MACAMRQLRTSVATVGIFLAASRLFKRFRSPFYLFTGILNQAERVGYNKRSRSASSHMSICRSLLLKVKTVFIPLLTRNRFYWVLECLAAACILLALDLAVRLIMRGGVEIRSLVLLGAACWGGAVDSVNSINPINCINYVNPIDR